MVGAELTDHQLLDDLVPVFAAVLGLAVGSFLNVVIHRVPRGESVVNPPSACPSCGAQIRNRHNVPVLGWLVLRGRCYDCKAPINVRYPIVEAGTGVLFALVAIRFVDDLGALPAYLAFAAVGIALAAIDFDVKRLPNAIVLPSYPVLAVLLAFDWDHDDLLRSAIGAAALFGFYLVVALAAPGAMGFGDVKLAGLIGGMTAYLSWGTLLVGAFLGFLFGALAGVMLMAAGRAQRKSALPFGPFMLLGGIAAVLGAGYLGDYYLDLIAL